MYLKYHDITFTFNFMLQFVVFNVSHHHDGLAYLYLYTCSSIDSLTRETLETVMVTKETKHS